MTVPNSTLEEIQRKVRLVTGQYTEEQLSTEDIDQYINTFYLQDLPEHLRLLDLKTNYSFVTQPNLDWYNFPVEDYISIEPPVFIAGYPTQFFQDQGEFYSIWPTIQNLSQFSGLADGSGGPYDITIVQTPVLPGRTYLAGISIAPERSNIQSFVMVTAPDATGAMQVLRDDANGGFLDNNTGLDVPGVINYSTGEITGLVFPNQVPAGETINVQSVPYSPGRPTAVLFYNNQFVIRPVPFTSYQVTMQAYILPTKFTGQNSNPQLKQWWQMLAYGAACKYFADYRDLEGLQFASQLLEEQMLLAERRTLKQITNNRVSTLYSRRPFGGPYYQYFLPGNFR